MKKIYREIGLIVLVVFGFCKNTTFAGEKDDSEGWKAGVARVAITPRNPCGWLDMPPAQAHPMANCTIYGQNVSHWKMLMEIRQF
jgi:hypothetical protein